MPDSAQAAPPSPKAPSFLRYVEARKAARATRRREGALYAYGPDARFRAALARLRPVALAVQAAERELRRTGWSRLLDGATPLSQASFPAPWRQLALCAERLGIPTPRAFVTSTPSLRDVTALGDGVQPAVLLPAALLDRLDEAARLSALGHACGRIPHDHAPLLTALHHLEHTEASTLRWAGRPAALLLGAWATDAAVTADRASLLCGRDLAAAQRALAARAEALGLPAGDPLLRARQAALAVFARTAFYRGGGATDPAAPGAEAGRALTLGECERRTRALLAGRADAGGDPDAQPPGEGPR